jgi:hypothetical protein
MVILDQDRVASTLFKGIVDITEQATENDEKKGDTNTGSASEGPQEEPPGELTPA